LVATQVSFSGGNRAVHQAGLRVALRVEGSNLGSDLNQLPLAMLNIPLQLTLLGLEAGIVYVSDRIPLFDHFLQWNSV
jgi:hypothetical protein